MAKAAPIVDEERLPWLEPYRDGPAAKAPPPPPAPKSRGTGFAIGVVAAIAAAMGGGYYLGQRDRADAVEPAGPTLIAEAPVTPPPAPIGTEAPADSPPAEAPAAPDDAVVELRPAVPAPVAETRPAAKSAARPNRTAARQRALRNLANERARLRERRFAKEQARAAAVAAATARRASTDMRRWPKMPSPGPAGQVVQLGAFRTEGRALAVYRSRLARYPVLGSMPRVVVPVITKPRGQVLYVLRLGTASRQQSRVICRNLKASGDHCIVIG